MSNPDDAQNPLSPTVLSGQSTPAQQSAPATGKTKSLADITAGKKTLADIAAELLGGGE